MFGGAPDASVGAGGRGGRGSGGSPGSGGAIGRGTGGVAGRGTGGGSGGVAGRGTGGGLGGRGSGGAPGSGGNVVPRCVPGQSVGCVCADGARGAQVCRMDGTYGACSCLSTELARIRDGMVGSWIGTQQQPWVAPYRVKIAFGADGHYSAHCAQTTCPGSVFYYGSDDDSSDKTYALRDLAADGTGTGIIAIVFAFGNVNTGDLEEVVLSDDGTRLTFEFWPSWLGRLGPVTFDLVRAN